jgi:hypothetical protein
MTSKPWQRVSFWVILVLMAFAVTIALSSLGLKRDAKALPQLVAFPLIAVLALLLLGEFVPRVQSFFSISWLPAATPGSENLDESEEEALERELQEAEREETGGEVLLRDIPWRLVTLVFAGIVLYGVLVLAAGFVVAGLAFTLVFVKWYGGATWQGSVLLGVGTVGVMVALARLLAVDLYPGMLFGGKLPPF